MHPYTQLPTHPWQLFSLFKYLKYKNYKNGLKPTIPLRTRRWFARVDLWPACEVLAPWVTCKVFSKLSYPSYWLDKTCWYLNSLSISKGTTIVISKTGKKMLALQIKEQIWRGNIYPLDQHLFRNLEARKMEALNI